jgi:hypothetical protein
VDLPLELSSPEQATMAVRAVANAMTRKEITIMLVSLSDAPRSAPGNLVSARFLPSTLST